MSAPVPEQTHLSREDAAYLGLEPGAHVLTREQIEKLKERQRARMHGGKK